jgi:hypothetical protein
MYTEGIASVKVAAPKLKAIWLRDRKQLSLIGTVISKLLLPFVANLNF